MDDKHIAELRKFINTITEKKIQPFIDLKKLYDSGIYNLAVQMSTEHAAKHGDYTYLNQLFSLLDGTVQGSAFLSNLRPKLNFVFSDTKPRKLKKATADQVAKAAKQTAASKPIAVKSVPVKKKDKPKVKLDIMDSRLMLPGSYGTGRQR